MSPNKRYVYYFTPATVQLRLNRYGGCFDNGRPLPEMQRERVLDLYHDGFGHRQIAREVRSSPGFVQKVIDRYNEQNTSLKAARVDYPRPKIDEAALEYIEVQKVRKPSIYSSEIQQRLLLDGVVHPANNYLAYHRSKSIKSLRNAFDHNLHIFSEINSLFVEHC